MTKLNGNCKNVNNAFDLADGYNKLARLRLLNKEALQSANTHINTNANTNTKTEM